MSAILRASYPVSFQLLNRDRQPILGIFEGQQGQTLKLEITNSSRRNMKTRQLTGNPSPSNHHFELRFRPGTLILRDSASPSRPAVSVEEPGWKISERPIVDDAGVVSFYLLISNATTIEAGKSTSVTLNNLSGDGKIGAHGTRVELKWNNNLEYLASAAGQTPEPLVPGHRLQHLSIVNESGQQHIPLHVGFVGNDKVLNNGSKNELKLRITSLLKEDEGNIELNQETTDRTKPPGTKFILSFDASPASALEPPAMNPWALGFINEVNKIVINAGTRFNTPSATVLGQSVQWIMWPTTQITLGPGEYIDFEITPILTKHPSGLTNLYIKYKNIPGYWDGNFVVPIEKAPLVYKEQLVGTKKEQYIGVATADPKADLHVNGKLQAKSLEFDKNGKILFDHLEITSTDEWHGILFHQSQDKLEFRERGQIIFSPGAEQKKETHQMVIKKDGKVGIGFLPNDGKLDPASHLHVAGPDDQEIMIQSTDEGGRKWSLQASRGTSSGRFEIVDRTAGHNRFTILANGKVGIGTVEPAKGMLEVASHANTEVNGYGYINNGVQPNNFTGREPRTLTLPYSIWASRRVAAEEFNAVSDERIKSIRGRADGAADLSTLLGIEVTDYTYKDVIGKGAGTYKKLIGQQVEKVFPQAVTRATDVVPDIYQQASIRDGWISLATDLKKGERVKLITEKGKEEIVDVLEVAQDKFHVDLETEGDKVFVFGREVDDFRTVDYDAISMLNVSATQQLKKEMDHELKALRVENAELRAANDALAKRLQRLESNLEAFTGVMAAAGGSNGNGRH